MFCAPITRIFMTLFKCRAAAKRTKARRQTVDSIEDVRNFVKSALRYDDEKPDQKFRRGKLVKKNKKNDLAWQETRLRTCRSVEP